MGLRRLNPVNSVKETPCLPSSNTSVSGAAGISAREGIRENPCQSVAHPSINAQLELFPNGDFIARSNKVEHVYSRVNPNDWDDDGIPNDEDDAPFASANEPQFGPRQTLPEGADTNHYYWAEVVSPSANVRVRFEGNLRSQLPVVGAGQSDAEIEVRTEDGLT